MSTPTSGPPLPRFWVASKSICALPTFATSCPKAYLLITQGMRDCAAFLFYCQRSGRGPLPPQRSLPEITSPRLFLGRFCRRASPFFSNHAREPQSAPDQSLHSPPSIIRSCVMILRFSRANGPIFFFYALESVSKGASMSCHCAIGDLFGPA